MHDSSPSPARGLPQTGSSHGHALPRPLQVSNIKSKQWQQRGQPDIIRSERVCVCWSIYMAKHLRSTRVCTNVAGRLTLWGCIKER